MTPGTAAARRKTVSFGAHVQDNEGKRQGKSGLPDSCPGKFPSPFMKSIQGDEGKKEVADRTRGRNTLTEKLEQVREESAKRKSVSMRQFEGPVEVSEEAAELTDHTPEYWRIVFEQYRERSERECRKLVAKQKAAKSFAREKDVQLMDTADQLRQEKKKVDRLERQVADLQSELKEYQEKLRASQAEERNAKEEALRLKRGSGLTAGYRRHGDLSANAATRVQELEQPARAALRTRASRERLGHDVKTVTENERASPISRARVDNAWAPSAVASSLIPPKPEALPRNEVSSQPQNLSTLPQESFSVALSMGLQPPSPQRDRRSDSPMRSPTRTRPKTTENLAITIPDSSAFLPDAENERPNVLTGTPVPIRSPVLSPIRSPKRATASIMKENNSPTPKSATRRWQRDKSDVKDQIQVSVTEQSEMDDVMKEARLRLARSGRVVS